MRTFLAALLLISAAPALADEECRIDAGPNDVVKKTGDVIIEAGQNVEDAIALDGKVIIKNGAKVKSAVSFHGSVIVEDGAKVTKTALAVGGIVTVAKGATVKNTLELSERGLKLRGDDGDDIDVNINIGGKSLGQRIADEALAKMKNCKIATK
jgi:NDP-sugar pyrophosphorylase family protein